MTKKDFHIDTNRYSLVFRTCLIILHQSGAETVVAEKKQSEEINI